MARSSRRLVILLVALLGTFFVVRGGMLLRPNADVFVAGFNIHHLFTGVLVVTICVIPLVVGTTIESPRSSMIVVTCLSSAEPGAVTRTRAPTENRGDCPSATSDTERERENCEAGFDDPLHRMGRALLALERWGCLSHAGIGHAT